MKKERRRSYRDRYFENWQAEKVACSNRKGWRMVYRYVGPFCRYAPAAQGRTLKLVKWEMLSLLLIGAAVYIPAMLSGTALTRCRMSNGFGVLSVLAWLISAYGVVRFAADHEYMKKLTADEVDQCIRIGCVAHAALLVLSVIAGGIRLITDGAGSPGDILVAAAVCASAGCSVAVRCLFSNLLMTTHQNEGGLPVC